MAHLRLVPALSPREILALEALRQANSIQMEQDQKDPKLWYVIDTSKADPDVDYPGDHLAGPVWKQTAQLVVDHARAKALLDFANSQY